MRATGALSGAGGRPASEVNLEGELARLELLLGHLPLLCDPVEPPVAARGARVGRRGVAPTGRCLVGGMAALVEDELLLRRRLPSLSLDGNVGADD